MRLFVTLSLFFLLAFPALAKNPAASSDIRNVETYLRGISTLKARFIQTDSMGQQVSGNFYLQRPGRMRFQYDAPLTDFIVADGLFIYYYDGQMKQQSSAPISQSLADFFLRKDLKLSGDISVSDVARARGLLQITLTQTADPLAGSLTLGFSEKPFQLKKWRVLDAEGAVTEVELFDAAMGIKLDADLFRYYDPEHKKPQLN